MKRSHNDRPYNNFQPRSKAQRGQEQAAAWLGNNHVSAAPMMHGGGGPMPPYQNPMHVPPYQNPMHVPPPYQNWPSFGPTDNIPYPQNNWAQGPMGHGMAGPPHAQGGFDSDFAGPPNYHPMHNRLGPPQNHAQSQHRQPQRQQQQGPNSTQQHQQRAMPKQQEVCSGGPPVDIVQHIESFYDLHFPADVEPPEESTSKLTRSLLRLYHSKRQSREVLNTKVRLWKKLTQEFRRMWPDCRTHLFGSSLSGFGSGSSDIDMCIFPWWDGQEPALTKKRDLEFLYGARRALRGRLRGLTDGDIEVIPAKVPIMKLVTRDGGYEVDLSVQVSHGTRNTHLLYNYCQLDPRVRPLVVCVKMWAKKQGVNDASQGTFSSYTLTLLVLHYLQVGAVPAVVPSLQRKAPHKFNPDRANIFSLSYESALPDFQSENRQELGDLLKGFFLFFANSWDFTNDVASVRTGKTLTNESCHAYAKENNLPPGQWKAYICVEEPLDRTNAARAIVRRPGFDDILAAFKDAAEEVERNKGVRLERLFGEDDDST